MNEFEFLLMDRVGVIQEIDKKFDLAKNAYLSFSGGKDSTILSWLLDYALPNNTIPRVFIDTGIEYAYIRDFVFSLADKDSRFRIIKPNVPIVQMLRQDGYPFKSKEHSLKVSMFQNGSKAESLKRYLDGSSSFSCPKCLLYQFTDSFTLNLSNKCCYRMKKEPVKKWENDNNRHVSILGLRMGEGGQRRNHSGCIVAQGGKLIKFKPLNPVSDEFEDWIVKTYDIQLCRLYYPPFNFKRTGCKGCPFSLDLQEQLKLMDLYLPAERKQCEFIWKPVYSEYRRIGYRLDRNEQMRLF